MGQGFLKFLQQGIFSNDNLIKIGVVWDFDILCIIHVYFINDISGMVFSSFYTLRGSLGFFITARFYIYNPRFKIL